MALLARIANGDGNGHDDMPPDTCDSDFFIYTQCVYFDNLDDDRGTYNKNITAKACAALEHGKFPPFEFVDKDRACQDVQGIGDNRYRRICNTVFADVCFKAGGKVHEGGGVYGSNAGETLAEMYSYADGENIGNVTGNPHKH
ncbi:hypothetical protein EJ03DRAFT_349896 [Teratosphaeria nubilosa]|uniref:Uncharacterized protein n=1 Tax=Teratosphaeria nubilosa TaxID=161662 RepID=A0A6G1LEY9_9PEZI|nr:hypothetical protein EJ03DRAFT_349896 [Teratosphaeria nubilosa]